MKDNNDYHHGGELNRRDIIDLSVNINNFCKVPKLSDEEIMRATAFYPDRESKELAKCISKRSGVCAGNIIVGNGASEIITLSAFCLGISAALIVEPTFSGYERALNAAGVNISYCYLFEKDDFIFGNSQIEAIEKFLREYGHDSGCAVYICNPNNPTGVCIAKSVLKRVLDICFEAKAKLVIDESFVDFTSDIKKVSMASFVEDYPNLFIIRSFTKINSIPGIRLGYGMCSDKDIVGKIKLMQPEWSVSGIAQVVGKKLLSNDAYLQNTISFIQREKTYLTDGLSDMGIKVYPSDTNYILTRIKTKSDFHKLLLDNGLYLRNCDNFLGLSGEYFRIAIGSHSDNEKLLEIFKKLL